MVFSYELMMFKVVESYFYHFNCISKKVGKIKEEIIRWGCEFVVPSYVRRRKYNKMTDLFQSAAIFHLSYAQVFYVQFENAHKNWQIETQTESQTETCCSRKKCSVA